MLAADVLIGVLELAQEQDERVKVEVTRLPGGYTRLAIVWRQRVFSVEMGFLSERRGRYGLIALEDVTVPWDRAFNRGSHEIFDDAAALVGRIVELEQSKTYTAPRL